VSTGLPRIVPDERLGGPWTTGPASRDRGPVRPPTRRGTLPHEGAYLDRYTGRRSRPIGPLDPPPQGPDPPSVRIVRPRTLLVVAVSRTASLLVVALVPAGVGLVDVLRNGESDLVLVLTALLILLAAALATALRDRRAVELRPDLAGWLRTQSAATGEPVERLADRCVAAYRAGLAGVSEDVA
jgi:hypothetical protein